DRLWLGDAMQTLTTSMMPRAADRLDWPAIRDRGDLAAVATALLGPAPGRRGGRGRRLWWACPFPDARNPSPAGGPGKPGWRCFGCAEHGDAVDLARRLNPGWSFRDAATWLAEQAGMAPPSGNPARPKPPAAKPAKAPSPPEAPSGLALPDAL